MYLLRLATRSIVIKISKSVRQEITLSEAVVEKTYPREDTISRTRRSYQAALHTRQSTAWITWIIVLGTLLLWCFTAYRVAQSSGAHSLSAILSNIANNAINVQDKDNDALTTVLTMYGAKDNALILQGQYWRFVTPIFLHVNALHVGMNMLNLLLLGIFLERILGHLRFLLIYLVTGIISVIASFYFAPQEISVGASGAIFGLVGAYSIFVLVHRRAFLYGGIPSLLWLVLVIGANLSVGMFIQNVDNYAHVGGLVSGCWLGWWFTPLYRPSPDQALRDVHRLSQSWPLALLTILGTLVLALIALYLMGARFSL
jgi:membrane associated rhomboid family serine protease